MRVLRRYALLLVISSVVGLCFIGARLPVSAISGKSPHATPSFPMPGAHARDTLEAAMQRGDVARDAIQPLAGRSFRFAAPPPWPAGSEALRSVRELRAQFPREAAATYRIARIVDACRIAAQRGGGFRADPLASGPSIANGDADAWRLDDCATLLANTGIMRTDWLLEAAMQGSLEAAVLLAASMQTRPFDTPTSPEQVPARREAATRLWRVARLGNAEALITLANGHRVGTPVERDPVRAYAFYLAWTRLSPAFGTAAHEQRYAAGLSDTEKAEALSRSRDIHRACCARPRSMP